MVSLLKISIKYGVIAGLLGSALIIALYYMGRHPFLFPMYFDFRIILFAVFMFFALKEYRDFNRGGILSFWEGLVGCLTLVTIFALITSLAVIIFGKMEPEFVTSFIILFKEQVKSFPPEIIEQIGKDNLDRSLKELSETDSYDMAQSYFSQSYIISFFTSIIMSVALRRQPKL